MQDYVGNNKPGILKKIGEKPLIQTSSLYFIRLVFIASSIFFFVCFAYLLIRPFDKKPNENIFKVIDNSLLSEEDIIPEKLFVGQSIAEIDPLDVLRAIKNHDWIQSVQVKKVPPNRLLIRVKETKPLSYFLTPKGMYMLGNDLKVLLPIRNPEGWNLPLVIDGSLKGTFKAGEILNYNSLNSLRLLVDSIYDSKPFLSLDRVSYIEITDPLNIKVKLVDSKPVLYFGTDQFPRKISNLRKFFSSNPKIDKSSVIDLRYSNKISTY